MIKRYLLVFILIVFSCNLKDNNYLLRKSTGNLHEIIFVIDSNLWDSETGMIIKNNLFTDIKGLPQKEKLFKLIQINHKDFSSIYKTHKNIILVSLNDRVSSFYKDKWSINQLYFELYQKNISDLNNYLKSNLKEIKSKIIEANFRRNFKKISTNSNNKIEKKISTNYKIKMTVPDGYKIAEEKEGFFWVRKDYPKENIISNIYFNIINFKNINQFSKHNLIFLRDSIGEIHIKGKNENSHMTTEILYDPIYSKFNNDPFDVKIIGLWTMKNGFMGGPFTSRALLSFDSKKLIYVEGFLYSPNKSKREYLFDLNTVIKNIQVN